MKFTLYIQSNGALNKLAPALCAMQGFALKQIETRAALKGSWLDFEDENVHLRLYENSDYDPKLLQEDDAWMYYRYILEATSHKRRGAEVETFMKQISNTLLRRIHELKGQGVLLADWD